MSFTTPPIKLAFADDHVVVRKGTIAYLQSDELNFMLEADNGEEMLEKLECADVLPDICIADISMKKMDGFEMTLEIKRLYPEIKVLALTVYDSEFNRLRMIGAGVNGYMVKSSDPEDLILAIKKIHTEDFYFPENVTAQYIKQARAGSLKSYRFSEKEMATLEYCCTDLPYDKIADKLGMSNRAIEGIIRRLFKKLDVNSRVGLVLLAIHSGLVTTDTIGALTKS